MDFEERLNYFKSFPLLEDQDDEESDIVNPPIIFDPIASVSERLI